MGRNPHHNRNHYKYYTYSQHYLLQSSACAFPLRFSVTNTLFVKTGAQGCWHGNDSQYLGSLGKCPEISFRSRPQKMIDTKQLLLLVG